MLHVSIVSDLCGLWTVASWLYPVKGFSKSKIDWKKRGSKHTTLETDNHEAHNARSDMAPSPKRPSTGTLLEARTYMIFCCVHVSFIHTAILQHWHCCSWSISELLWHQASTLPSSPPKSPPNKIKNMPMMEMQISACLDVSLGLWFCWCRYLGGHFEDLGELRIWTSDLNFQAVDLSGEIYPSQKLLHKKCRCKSLNLLLTLFSWTRSCRCYQLSGNGHTMCKCIWVSGRVCATWKPLFLGSSEHCEPQVLLSLGGNLCTPSFLSEFDALWLPIPSFAWNIGALWVPTLTFARSFVHCGLPPSACVCVFVSPPTKDMQTPGTLTEGDGPQRRLLGNSSQDPPAKPPGVCSFPRK